MSFWHRLLIELYDYSVGFVLALIVFATLDVIMNRRRK